MTDLQIKKREIESALAKIPSSAFLDSARNLLGVLGYRSQRTLKLSGSVDEFIENLPALNKNTVTEQEFRDEAESLGLVFQVTSSEIATDNQQDLFESNGFDEGEIKSFLFFAVELKDKDYPRGKYAQFTREINKRFMMPVVVFFRVRKRLTVGFVGRRQHKHDSERDVAENYDCAIADYNKAIQLKSNLAEAYINRGVAYGKRHEYNLAIEDYTTAIRLKPTLAEAYNNRGVAFYKQDDYTCAIADYNKAIQLKRDYAEAYYNRGEVQLRLTGWEKAREDFNAAKNKGADIIAGFHNDYKSVKDFEERHRVNLPEDIAAILTPLQE